MTNPEIPPKKFTPKNSEAYQKMKDSDWAKKSRINEEPLIILIGDTEYEYCLHGASTLPVQLQKYGGVGFPNEYLFITENIPEQYRPYFLAHETFCLPHVGEDNHCLHATERELRIVPDEIKVDYLIYRKGFYENLLGYFVSLPKEQQNAQLISEISKSKVRIEQEVHNLAAKKTLQ